LCRITLWHRHLYIGHQKDHPSTRLAEAMTALILKLIAKEVGNGSWQARLAAL
jgi:hypothetical protein